MTWAGVSCSIVINFDGTLHYSKDLELLGGSKTGNGLDLKQMKIAAFHITLFCCVLLVWKRCSGVSMVLLVNYNARSVNQCFPSAHNRYVEQKSGYVDPRAK